MCMMKLFAYILAVKNDDNLLKQLRRHSLVIGWISCSLAVFLSFLFIAHIYELWAFQLYQRQIEGLVKSLGLGFLVALHLTNIVASLLLICGVRRENRLMLLPWLVNFIICPIIYLVLIDNFYDISLIVALRLLLVTGLSIYAWSTIFALYCKLKIHYADGIKGTEKVFVIDITNGEILKKEKLNVEKIVPPKMMNV